MKARTIRLNPATRPIARRMLDEAPDGHLFSPPKEPTRSLDQNARMWAMLGDVSKQVEWPVNGILQKLSPDDWKDIITASLRQENRMAMGIRGGFVMLGESTSRMTIKQMTEVIEFLFAFGTEKDVVWSERVDVPEWYQERVPA